ncbi:signal transduction histidine kinase [Mucilaginibacter yixingensis]|uniref:histidine kinase n=1 Tax=Mucilaginibacter yixingensis TaxID=1295612 RepID=A0A2T5J908_9SPHI|nr:HAMP domain-containing sensor histidine kinase [Mucilaginibacter yixingensis]PTQ96547.1 signal transduction histidine kinase [Mucilaginibacter yixingensis]
MKLAAQYTRASMLVTVIVLVIAGGIYYFAISYIADQQFDRDLTEEFGEMNEFVQQHQRFPKPFEFDSYQAKFEQIEQFIPPRFVDTIIKTTSARAIIATIRLNGINYRMTVVESKEATQNLMQLIFAITLGLTVVLLIALFLTNRVLLNGLWQPFYYLLNRLNTFSLTGKTGQDQQLIRIDEFQQLQTVIHVMEKRAATEYETLKSFTENASHEMMTPVAVITSKLDNLIQDDALTETHLLQLQDIYNASGKLSRLGQSLLLLVKIEHQLINDIVLVRLDQLLSEKMGLFAEIISEKSIAVNTQLQPVEITASSYLADILLNNLLGNAIRHNHHYGTITINLNEQSLVIANTGTKNTLDSTKIFERFQKGPESEGTGLGLTIARNICNGYGWNLNYSFTASCHVFTITF